MGYEQEYYEKIIKPTKYWQTSERKKKQAEINKIYVKNNRTKVLLVQKLNYSKNKKRMKLMIAKSTKKRSIKLKTIVVEHYTKGTWKCSCCGFKLIDLAFSTIDHINNNGNEFRKKSHPGGSSFYKWIIKNDFPHDLQILCWNCNMGKYHNNGICPHTQ